MTGLIGVFCTALLISVIAQKLQLTRSEKYVHHFDINTRLAQKRRNQAANIIKFSIQSWYLKQKFRIHSRKWFEAENKLFRAIHINRHLQQLQRKLTDNCIGWPELFTLERSNEIKIQETAAYLMPIRSRMQHIEQRLLHIDETMVSMQKTLNLLLECTKR
jgi:hypothetical protein